MSRDKLKSLRAGSRRLTVFKSKARIWAGHTCCDKILPVSSTQSLPQRSTCEECRTSWDVLCYCAWVLLSLLGMWEERKGKNLLEGDQVRRWKWKEKEMGGTILTNYVVSFVVSNGARCIQSAQRRSVVVWGENWIRQREWKWEEFLLFSLLVLMVLWRSR